MGQDPARTVREIEAIRTRIDNQLAELADAFPPRDELVRRALLAATGAALAAFSLWFIVHRAKVNRRETRVKRLVKDAIRELNGAA